MVENFGQFGGSRPIHPSFICHQFLFHAADLLATVANPQMLDYQNVKFSATNILYYNIMLASYMFCYVKEHLTSSSANMFTILSVKMVQKWIMKHTNE